MTSNLGSPALSDEEAAEEIKHPERGL